MTSRDQLFVAAHRGGPLEKERHWLLAHWAADCAEHVLLLLRVVSVDSRCEAAIAVGRAWARAEVPVGDAQKASVECHALARELEDPVALAVARAAGHAVATAHFADHSLRAGWYAMKAVKVAGGSVEAEWEWQRAQLPDAVRALVISGMVRRFPTFLTNI